MLSSILIKNGRVVSPADGLDAVQDVLVTSEGIVTVESSISFAARDLVRVDAAGLLVVPGLIDAHVHFREPGFEAKETVRTGSAAAAAGGFSCVVCEPNTKPPCDRVDRLRDAMDRARREASVRVFQKVCITVDRAGQELSDMEALAAQPGFAAFSDDGDPVFDRVVMDAALARAAELGALVSPHCEDSARAVELAREQPERAGFRPGPPFTNEARYVERDLDLAARRGARLHIAHVSLAASLDLIRQGRASGVKVTCEVAPHHFCLDTEICRARGLDVAVCPPIRSPADREAVIEAVREGLVDVFACDHAPHTAADKAAGAHGIIGLETSLALVSTFLVGPGVISWPRAVEMMSVSPSALFGLDGGRLASGARGDVTLIDPARQWTVDPDSFASKSRNCPFSGWTLTGVPAAVIVGGALKHIHPRCAERVGGAT